MRKITDWEVRTQADPDGSRWYVERFRAMAAQGKDLAGEARMIDAMLARSARVLDAGCGSGRVGGELAARGHTVVGVDVDPALIEAARTDRPGLDWRVGDLTELDLPAEGVPQPFDVVVCAGNVLPYAAPGTQSAILGRLRAHLAHRGRVVVGFGRGVGRGYSFDQFFVDAADAGLQPDLVLSTWDLLPLAPDSDFLVAVLSAVAGADDASG
ncbi:class I SAM-dependent methyltransferase [Nocardiopsis ansamitocini]|uniref:class I SAM-dependent methyltransferase n=1 Tax=Nocardiopsis ansamitocini TaxID=1670832 RepID=UPI00255762FF|nr:class I SAM-dependent methyltransferase [Nocardiopsis ansamitocini]